MPHENTSEQPPASAQITVSRDSPDDVQVRQIVVSFDGERKTQLLFGDTITFAAAPGVHTLRVDNTWNHKDLQIEIKSGDDLRFLTKSTSGQFSRFLLVAFGAGPIYVSIEPVPHRS
jgi:hypothetical protein